jgi:ribosomal protein S4
MARYIGPKTKIARKFGAAIYGDDKSFEKRKNQPPGQHGPNKRRGAKKSEYAVQLAEKQKAKYTYGILERQFANLFDKAHRSKGVTGEVLLQLCESRLDNVNVVRMPLVQRRIQEMQAKQIEEHARLGYTRYNGDNASKTSKALKISDDNIRDLVYRRPSSPTSGVFAAIRAPEYINRRTVGKPLIKFWPVEALIVLTNPSDPKDRTHYIGILEQDGNPVKINDYSEGLDRQTAHVETHLQKSAAA